MKYLMHTLVLCFFCLCMKPPALLAQSPNTPKKPLRVAVVGLVHDHVHWILGRKNKGDIELVGIAEANRQLAEKYSKQHGYSMNLVYPGMEEMIRETKPDAVLAFNSIYDHEKVVAYCAPRGIHVMVEKPLAVSVAHANKMTALARKYHIQLLTNYETTWYGSNEVAYQWIKQEKLIGNISKIVFHTGHRGPVEIGCSSEFLSWLTDPVLNGSGALTDFGCYGANLGTWLLGGEKPSAITAITQQIKPGIYPKVEDDATIVLTYKKKQVIIQASWNWPFSRKDMEVYGQKGYIFCRDANNITIRDDEQKEAHDFKAPALPETRSDPFAYFAGVIQGEIRPQAYDLSSTENNELVVKILEAAKLSAKSGKTIFWKDLYKN